MSKLFFEAGYAAEQAKQAKAIVLAERRAIRAAKVASDARAERAADLARARYAEERVC